MRVLLVSTYELGHQPLSLGAPAARISNAGHETRCLDLSVEPWDESLADWPDAIAFSVPMHTAMRLATNAARALHGWRPDLPICFYGLYAVMGDGEDDASFVDARIAGEYESGLLEWLGGIGDGGPATTGGAKTATSWTSLARNGHSLPDRSSLPPLERYTKLVDGDRESLVGYVEASHGCSHRCRHCPVPVAYDGRTRAVASDLVLADIEQLVALGASHITFGDPDFLNRPSHSLEVARSMHERFDHLTFDVTAKVEHIVKYDVWNELASLGCLFVVSAVECLNNGILARLSKGHTAVQASAAVDLLTGNGIAMRPSFLPFTPWSTAADVAAILDFVIDHDLVDNVDPVQYSIRLLVPKGSLLLLDDSFAHGPYDAAALSYSWAPADPALDQLQQGIASIVEEMTSAPPAATFAEVRRLVLSAAGLPEDPERAAKVSALTSSSSARRGPHLTEPWFCCAEPTRDQLLGSLVP